MKRVVIFGAGNVGKKLIAEIEKTKGILIEGVADNANDVSIEKYPKVDVCNKKYTKTSVIIAMYDIHAAVEVYTQMNDLGYTSIFWYNGEFGLPNEDFGNIKLISKPYWGECVLPQVEMHIMDCCNLNCRGCTHFSPLFPHIIPDFESRCNDVVRLKEIFSYIAYFYILGGEPLLNPQLEEYICYIRKMLPETELGIVTNGLLIPSMKMQTLKCIYDNNVVIHISEYEPTHKIMGKIKAKLEEFNIRYLVREYIDKQNFCIPLTLVEESKYPATCLSNGCITVGDGKIARCPTLMYIGQFNKTFHVNLPSDGIVDMGDVQDGKELLNFLEQEVPLCRHCVENVSKWSRCGREITIDDFAVNE